MSGRQGHSNAGHFPTSWASPTLTREGASAVTSWLRPRCQHRVLWRGLSLADSLEAHSPGLSHRNPPAALRLRLPRFWDRTATPILSRPCGHSAARCPAKSWEAALGRAHGGEAGGGPGRSEGPLCRAGVLRRARRPLRARASWEEPGACGRGGGHGRDLRFPGPYRCSAVTSGAERRRSWWWQLVLWCGAGPCCPRCCGSAPSAMAQPPPDVSEDDCLPDYRHLFCPDLLR